MIQVCPRRAACAVQHARAAPAWVPSGWIDVACGDRSARVGLRRLVAVRLLGRDVVRLDDVWAAAHLGERATCLAFDFVGEDGFHLAADGATPASGRDLQTGYVCIATRDLIWQPVPERPCYWRVKGVVRVVAVGASLAAAGQ
jgi:hypothetical protein